MKNMIFAICVLGLIGNMSSCSADDANTHVKEYFSDPQVRALVISADDGDVKKMDQLIAAGVDVNARGKEGITPLIWTIYHHKIKGYQALLEHGADPNLQVQSGRHKGDSAMETASQEHGSSYLKLAIAHGGDPNLIDKYDADRRVPLFAALLANNKDNVALLIHAGADVNVVSNPISQETPLLSALEIGEYEIAYMLLQAGANYKLVYEGSGVNRGRNPLVVSLEHPGSLDPTSDAYKWRAKVIEFMNAHGIKVKSEPPTPMCSEDMGKGVEVTVPCNQLKPTPEH